MTRMDLNSTLAGLYYPVASEDLQKSLFEVGFSETAVFPTPPRAAIVPLAAYRNAGSVMAKAMNEIRDDVQRMILIIQAEYSEFDGIALPGTYEFRTPLGPVETDIKAKRISSKLPFVHSYPEVFEREIGIDLLLPCIQAKFPSARIAPFIIGKATPAEVAALLKRVWGPPTSFALIATNLSQHDTTKAQREHDLATAEKIENLDYRQIVSTDIDADRAVKGLLYFGQEHGLQPTRIAQSDSSKTLENSPFTVGYGAWLFHAGKNFQWPEETYKTLNSVALKAALAEFTPSENSSLVGAPYSFILQTHIPLIVGIKQHGQYLGYNGTMIGKRSAIQAVYHHATEAARLVNSKKTLSAEDLQSCSLQIRILGPRRRLRYKNKDELFTWMAQNQPGLILKTQSKEAYVFPEIWHKTNNPVLVWSTLLGKIKLPANYWSEFEVYGFSTVDLEEQPLA